MLVTDEEGILIGLLIESAQKSEARLAKRTLKTVQVGRRTRPRFLTCDHGYDSRAFRRYLRRRGIRSCIPTRRRPKSWKPRRGRPPVAAPTRYARRWKVERTFAWLLSNRRIVVRWEHHLSVYRRFVLIAMTMICLNRLLQ